MKEDHDDPRDAWGDAAILDMVNDAFTDDTRYVRYRAEKLLTDLRDKMQAEINALEKLTANQARNIEMLSSSAANVSSQWRGELARLEALMNMAQKVIVVAPAKQWKPLPANAQIVCTCGKPECTRGLAVSDDGGLLAFEDIKTYFQAYDSVVLFSHLPENVRLCQLIEEDHDVR